MIYVIDYDSVMARCVGRACGESFRIFSDAFSVLAAISAEPLPDLIFLDILLDGPDGLSLIHELASYPDTARIPIVIVSALKISDQSLEAYGVVGALNKDTMRPFEIRNYVEKYLKIPDAVDCHVA